MVRVRIYVGIVLACLLGLEQSSGQKEERLEPHQGPSRPDVSARTLHGKVLCGYQGWFRCPGDGCTIGNGRTEGELWNPTFQKADAGGMQQKQVCAKLVKC